jgi:hypothetical protein
MPSAHVISVERAQDEDGTPIVNVQVDLGGGEVTTLELALAPGDDSPPLPADVALMVEDGGAGTGFASGFQDVKNPGKSANGEKRFYAREGDGTPAAEFWLKKNGDVVITSLKSGGKVTINGVVIDQDGNMTVPGKVDANGEVTAMKSGPSVTVSQQLTPSPFGPLGPPTPGT